MGMKQDNLRPIFIHFAVPVVLSLVGAAISLIVTSKRRNGHRERMENREEGCASDFEINIPQSDGFESENRADGIEELQDDLISLSTETTTAVQKKEMGMEERVQKYVAMREHELLLMEVKSTLELEIAQVEILGVKLDSVETEINRSTECLMIEQQLEDAKLEMWSLKRKLRRLQRANRQSLYVMRRQTVLIRLIECEKAREVKEMKETITELRGNINHFEEHNQELKEKLKIADTLAQSASKVEQLQKEWLSDLAESINLRWINACLRYELFRIQEQQKLEQRGKEGGPVITKFYKQEEKEGMCQMCCEREGDVLHMETDGHGSSSKLVLFQKLKRWVKKKERCRRPPLSDSEDDLYKFPGRLSLSHNIAIKDIPGRNSC